MNTGNNESDAALNSRLISQPNALTTIDDLKELAGRASEILIELRRLMLLPNKTKSPPIISSEKLASLCNITKAQLNYRIKCGAPSGVIGAKSGRREFTISEVHEWTQNERKVRMRPQGKKAITMGVAFFKGGVTKTTTAVTLAQGLNMLGHRVLAIDMDPQGSLTTLLGYFPDSEINDEDTLGQLFHGEQTDVRYAIRDTYWPGISLIPASTAMFSSEFALPARQMRDSQFEFWNVLNKGLDAVRDEYDVIIIDTPPSLSYVTINAFFAADGMIVPMTASMLDMASSAQFWNLFSDLAESISSKLPVKKQYEFVNILLSKINNNDMTTAAIREWIITTYGVKVMPVEIPLTAVTSSASSEFSTIFDLNKYDGDSRTYKRALAAYEALSLAVEDSLVRIWKR